MSNKSSIRPLGAFLKALRQEKIDCILIGMMAAVEQGAPLSTVDYDLWVNLPERQYVRLLSIIQKQKGTILAPTFYELNDGSQVNVIFNPTGLLSFKREFICSRRGFLDGQPIRILSLARIIANKEAADREKDRMTLPILKQTLRLLRRQKLKR